LEIYPTGYQRYDEDAPEDLKKPAFLVSVTNQDYSKRMNTKYKSVVSFDVAYFSDQGAAEIKRDCLQKQEDLFRAFDFVGTFKTRNKNSSITNQVLHLTFDVSYSEMIIETGVPMQTKTVNTNTNI
jgi:hypothetical protein